jgi:hypothetical protein
VILLIGKLFWNTEELSEVVMNSEEFMHKDCARVPLSKENDISTLTLTSLTLFF